MTSLPIVTAAVREIRLWSNRMMNRRFAILRNAIKMRTLGGSIQDFAVNLLSPTCDVLGRRRIERVEEATENSKAVFIKGIPGPLYFPVEFDLHGLRQVLTEATYSWNWHNYLIPETSVAVGDVVIDCGAAEGFFSLLATAKGAGRVICIEPHPAYVRSLRRTFEGHSNVTVLHAAVGDAVGETRLTNSGMYSIVTHLPNGTIPIGIVTIDHLCSSLGIQPTYIKADIEGFEEKMLLGAAESIAMYHPKLAITTYHHFGAAEWIQSFLAKLNPRYKFYLKGLATEAGAMVMLHAWD